MCKTDYIKVISIGSLGKRTSLLRRPTSSSGGQPMMLVTKIALTINRCEIDKNLYHVTEAGRPTFAQKLGKRLFPEMRPCWIVFHPRKLLCSFCVAYQNHSNCFRNIKTYIIIYMYVYWNIVDDVFVRSPNVKMQLQIINAEISLAIINIT